MTKCIQFTVTMARTATSGIRVKTSLYKRMQAIQRQVEAAGSRKPTFTGIIEVWETESDPNRILEILIDSWREPGPADYAVSRAKRKRAKS